jgi:hypothetical protein
LTWRCGAGIEPRGFAASASFANIASVGGELSPGVLLVLLVFSNFFLNLRSKTRAAREKNPSSPKLRNVKYRHAKQRNKKRRKKQEENKEENKPRRRREANNKQDNAKA